MAAQHPEDLPGAVRRRVRDEIVSVHLLERMVKDIRFLLLEEEDAQEEPEIDVTYLWDNRKGTVANGHNYTDE